LSERLLNPRIDRVVEGDGHLMELRPVDVLSGMMRLRHDHAED
jgi:hypothetical protein